MHTRVKIVKQTTSWSTQWYIVPEQIALTQKGFKKIVPSQQDPTTNTYLYASNRLGLQHMTSDTLVACFNTTSKCLCSLSLSSAYSGNDNAAVSGRSSGSTFLQVLIMV